VLENQTRGGHYPENGHPCRGLSAKKDRSDCRRCHRTLPSRPRGGALALAPGDLVRGIIGRSVSFRYRGQQEEFSRC
jgi:hypothetical protein